MARQVCPACHKGRIFGSLLKMNERCPHCGLRFERETGYFTGAMYVSYGLMIPPLTAVYFVWLAMGWPTDRLLLWAFLTGLPLVPFVMRISRVIWIHIDRALDP